MASDEAGGVGEGEDNGLLGVGLHRLHNGLGKRPGLARQPQQNRNPAVHHRFVQVGGLPGDAPVLNQGWVFSKLLLIGFHAAVAEQQALGVQHKQAFQGLGLGQALAHQAIEQGLGHPDAPGPGPVDQDALVGRFWPLIRQAESTPASVTAPVPWMSSLKEGSTLR